MMIHHIKGGQRCARCGGLSLRLPPRRKFFGGSWPSGFRPCSTGGSSASGTCPRRKTSVGSPPPRHPSLTTRRRQVGGSGAPRGIRDERVDLPAARRERNG